MKSTRQQSWPREVEGKERIETVEISYSTGGEVVVILREVKFSKGQNSTTTSIATLSSFLDPLLIFVLLLQSQSHTFAFVIILKT